MTLIETSQLGLLVLLAIAAGSDLALRRIPNWAAVAIALLGVAVQLDRGGPSAAAGSAVVACAFGAVLVVSWRLGFVGGGDVKLATAVSFWMYPDRTREFFLASALAGLVVALPHYGSALRRVSHAGPLAGGPAAAGLAVARAAAMDRRVPFGVAIALGGAFAVLWR